MGFFDFLDSNNHVLSKIDSSEKLYDRNNHVIGKITWSGDVQDANNHTLGHISNSGEVRNRWYSKLGSVSSNGDVVVGYIDKEFTVKYLDLTHKKDGWIELRPANDSFKPIRIDEESNFKVWGVVIYTIKKWK